MNRPCPPNGLARAAWWRDFAAETETSDPQHAAYCRATAASIERRAFSDMPLVRIMSGEQRVNSVL